MSAACELDGQDKQQRERERGREREGEREREANFKTVVLSSKSIFQICAKTWSLCLGCFHLPRYLLVLKMVF